MSLPHEQSLPRSPISQGFFIDPRTGAVSPSTTRLLPPASARGGSFLPPVSTPPSRPFVRRPSATANSPVLMSPHLSGSPGAAGGGGGGGESVAHYAGVYSSSSPQQEPYHHASSPSRSPAASSPYALPAPRGPRRAVSVSNPTDPHGGGHQYSIPPTQPIEIARSSSSSRRAAPEDTARAMTTMASSVSGGSSVSSVGASSPLAGNSSLPGSRSAPSSSLLFRGGGGGYSSSLTPASLMTTADRHQQMPWTAAANQDSSSSLSFSPASAYGSSGHYHQQQYQQQQQQQRRPSFADEERPTRAKFYPTAINGGKGGIILPPPPSPPPSQSHPPKRPPPPAHGLYSPPEPAGRTEDSGRFPSPSPLSPRRPILSGRVVSSPMSSGGGGAGLSSSLGGSQQHHYSSSPPVASVGGRRPSQQLTRASTDEGRGFFVRPSMSEDSVRDPTDGLSKKERKKLEKEAAAAAGGGQITPRKSSGVLRTLFGKKKEAATAAAAAAAATPPSPHSSQSPSASPQLYQATSSRSASPQLSSSSLPPSTPSTPPRSGSAASSIGPSGRRSVTPTTMTMHASPSKIVNRYDQHLPSPGGSLFSHHQQQASTSSSSSSSSVASSSPAPREQRQGPHIPPSLGKGHPANPPQQGGRQQQPYHHHLREASDASTSTFSSLSNASSSLEDDADNTPHLDRETGELRLLSLPSFDAELSFFGSTMTPGAVIGDEEIGVAMTTTTTTQSTSRRSLSAAGGGGVAFSPPPPASATLSSHAEEKYPDKQKQQQRIRTRAASIAEAAVRDSDDSDLPSKGGDETKVLSAAAPVDKEAVEESRPSSLDQAFRELQGEVGGAEGALTTTTTVQPRSPPWQEQELAMAGIAETIGPSPPITSSDAIAVAAPREKGVLAAPHVVSPPPADSTQPLQVRRQQDSLEAPTPTATTSSPAKSADLALPPSPPPPPAALLIAPTAASPPPPAPSPAPASLVPLPISSPVSSPSRLTRPTAPSHDRNVSITASLRELVIGREISLGSGLSSLAAGRESADSAGAASSKTLATVPNSRQLLSLDKPRPVAGWTSMLPEVILTKELARSRTKPRMEVRHEDTIEKLQGFLFTLRTAPARAQLIRGGLLPLLYDAERRGFDPSQRADNKALRALAFEGLAMFIQKGLWLEQSANERGAVLEAVAALVESPWLSIKALESDEEDRIMFGKVMRSIISFVRTKLSSKGIFQNTLGFASRMLAFAFFRVEGIAQQLLTALPVTRMALARLQNQVAEGEMASFGSTRRYRHLIEPFPTYLAPFVFENPRAYLSSLGSATCVYDDPEDDDAFRFQPGNWLRRWQSDDSELFFAFFRAYHKFLVGNFPSLSNADDPRTMRPSVLFSVPGYAHLATIFVSKCLSYVRNKVVSVTTSTTSSTFNANEGALGSSSGKPNVLESANRRLSATINFLVATPALVDIERGIEVDGARVWASMTDIWVRSLVTRTNLYEPRGVFCLFDLLDAVATLPSDPFTRDVAATPARSSPSRAFSNSFILKPLAVILREGDHSLTICKCISFIFQHWETLTATPEDRTALLDLLLDRPVFERLVLFWSQSVRSYVVRLIIFRLSHLHLRDRASGRAAGGAAIEPSPAEVETVHRLNVCLEAIRKRYAELEPSVLGAILEDEDDDSEGNAALSSGAAAATASGAVGESSGDGSLSMPTPSPPLLQQHGPTHPTAMSRSKSTIAMVPIAAPVEPEPAAREEFIPAVPANSTTSSGHKGDSFSSSSGRRSSDGTNEVMDVSAMSKASKWLRRLGGGGKKKAAAAAARSASGGNVTPSKGPLPGISETSEATLTSPTPSTTTLPPLPAPREPGGGPRNTPSPALSSSTGRSSMPSDSNFSPTRSSFDSLSIASSTSALFSDKDAARPKPHGSVMIPHHSASSPSLASSHPSAPSSTSSSSTSLAPSFASTPATSLSSLSTTHAPAAASTERGVFSFEFATSPVSDSFDSPSSTSQLALAPNGVGSSASSPTTTAIPGAVANPRMSRSYSRRSSLLTPLASSVLEALANGDLAKIEEEGRKSQLAALEKKKEPEGYDKRLHPYAVRFFAEMEDCLSEYNEWYGADGPGTLGDGSPPRLSVSWSFYDDED